MIILIVWGEYTVEDINVLAEGTFEVWGIRFHKPIVFDSELKTSDLLPQMSEVSDVADDNGNDDEEVEFNGDFDLISRTNVSVKKFASPEPCDKRR